METSSGASQWERLRFDQSPIGGPGSSTYFLTGRGGRTIAAAGHKAVKKIALSQRGIQVTFVVPLEDAWDMSSAWAASVEVDDKLVPGGVATGKIVTFEISQGAANDFAKAAITIECCDGGVAGLYAQHGVNSTNERWDGVVISSPAAYPPNPSPVPGAFIQASFAPGDQVAYVQACDFTGLPGRNDRTKNDPHHLLTECKTQIDLADNPINGQPALVSYIPLTCTPWSGPRQVATVTV